MELLSQSGVADVFVSYSRSDSDFGRRLHQTLQAKDRKVWMDWEDIPLTADWWREICLGIEESDIFVFLISPDSMASAVCNLEVEYAQKLHKRIVPVLYRTVDDQVLQRRLQEQEYGAYVRSLLENRDVDQFVLGNWKALSALNWVLFPEDADFDRHLEDLLTALDTDVENVHHHTRFLVRALEWERRDRNTSLVLRGDDLKTAEAWLATGINKSPEPTNLHAEYILASRTAEKQQQQRLLAWVSSALVVMMILAGVAFYQFRRALYQAEVSQSIALAAQSQLELERMLPERSILFALEALQNYPYTWQAERALGLAVQSSRARRILSEGLGRILDVAWSPDGARIVAASSEGTVQVWDAESSKVLLSLDHPRPVWSVSWSPEGLYLVTGSGSIAQVWDIAHGTVQLTLNGPERVAIRRVAWSPDGKRIATYSDDDVTPVMQVWDAETGDLIQEARPFFGATSMAWSPDSTKLAVGGWRDEAWVWEVESGNEVLRLEGITDWVTSVAWSPDGAFIATGGWDSRVRIWNAETGTHLMDLNGHTDWITDIEWSPDGSQLSTTSQDSTTRLWETDSGDLLLVLGGHTSWVNASAWSPDGQHLITGGEEGLTREWDVSLGNELAVIRVPIGSVNSVAWSGDSSQLLTGTDYAVAGIWDGTDANQLGELTAPDAGLNDVTWSPDGTRVVGGGRIGVVWVWDVSGGEIIHTWRCGPGSAAATVWSPDSSRIVTAGDNGCAQVRDVETGTELALIGHDEDVLGADWSPDGQRIATASADSTVRIWDSNSGQELMRLEGHDAGVGDVAWSPDGAQLASGGHDMAVRIWDAENGEELRLLAGHRNEINAVAWSPNGTRIASASGSRHGVSTDNSIRIWNVKEGVEVLAHQGHTAAVVDVSWSPDGTRLSSASRDGSARIWRVWQTADDLVEYAQSCCAVRELTELERQQFNLSAP
jgi:WD40 repeat protein